MKDPLQYNNQAHHRRSIRLKGYDYAQEGLYFITICVENEEHLFGEIIASKMVLNEIGKIANTCWLEIPHHFPKASLHEYIIMPNHIHGIIELTKSAHAAEVQHVEPQQNQPKHLYQKIIPGSIGSIIRGYKGAVTKCYRQNELNYFHPYKIWQRNYYEHIIHDRKGYLNITRYINETPRRKQRGITSNLFTRRKRRGIIPT